MNSPTYTDWVLSVLGYLEELDIYIDIGEFKDMKK